MEFKIAIAQAPTIPGMLPENADLIIERIREARSRGADLVVFPELALTGYLVMDLCFSQDFLNEQQKHLERVAVATKGTAAVVGFIRQEKRPRPGGRPSLYNSALLISDGEVLGHQDKILLPDYNIYDERRYFLAGNTQRVFSLKGKQIGVGICEDLWSTGYEKDPLGELKAMGSELFVTISASPYEIGKYEQRMRVIDSAVSRHHTPLIYANLFGSFDGFDGEVVFDGRSVGMSGDGSLLAMGREFEEDFIFFDPFKGPAVPRPAWSEVEEIFSALITGIRFYCSRHNFSRAIVGISGGIDSAVVAALACEALGRQNVTGVSMPSRYSSDGTRNDALKLAQNLGFNFINVPIEKPFAALLDLLREDPKFAALPEGVTEENIQPRLRMTILYALANKFGGIVLNTGNKTELALGYCTIYGDLAGGLAVIADLNKQRVYELAAYINDRAAAELIPASVITRAPSAELAAGQLDEQGMGAPPQVLAPLIDALVEGMSAREAQKIFKGKFAPALIEKSWRTLHANEWKRRQAAPGIRITRSAFGHGRRVPLAHGFHG